jgi:hypothetical protein
MATPIEFEKVSFDEAKAALDTKLRDDEAKGWRGERSPERDEPLHEATVRWMDSLPASLRPVELARDFPRVTNQLAEVWKRPARCDELLERLMLDRRGDRQGFPPNVAAELTKLATHYAAVFPYRRSIWDDVVKK